MNIHSPSRLTVDKGWLAAAALVFLLLIAATNRPLGFREGIDFVMASDSVNYEQIAAAAPDLPSQPMLVHHAQRFLPHYLLGSFAKLSGISVETLYRAVTAALALLIAWYVRSFFAILGLSRGSQVFGLALFFANPYVVRYYLLAPPMICDLLFLLGTAVLVAGLTRGSVTSVVVGIVLATVGKQLSPALVPGFAFWVWFGAGWRERSRTQRALVIAGASLAMALVLVGENIASKSFQGSLMPAGIILSMAHWILSGNFVLSLFAEHLIRIALPFFLPLAAFLALKPKRTDFAEVGAALMAAGLLAYPLLHDPVTAQQSQGRYGGLACVFALYILASALARRESAKGAVRYAGWPLYVLGAAIFAGSLHHMFSAFGPATAAGFLALQVAASLFVGFAFYVLLARYIRS